MAKKLTKKQKRYLVGIGGTSGAVAAGGGIGSLAYGKAHQKLYNRLMTKQQLSSGISHGLRFALPDRDTGLFGTYLGVYDKATKKLGALKEAAKVSGKIGLAGAVGLSATGLGAAIAHKRRTRGR